MDPVVRDVLQGAGAGVVRPARIVAEDAAVAVPDRVTAAVPAHVDLDAVDAVEDVLVAVQTAALGAGVLVLETAIPAVQINAPVPALRIVAGDALVVATPVVLDVVDAVGLVVDAVQIAVRDVPVAVGIVPEDAPLLAGPPAAVPAQILAADAIQPVIVAVSVAEDVETAAVRIVAALVEALARVSASERRQRLFLNIWRE